MKRTVLIFSFVICAVPKLFSNESSAEKKFAKEWPVSGITSLSFTAKYQDVQILFWNESKVKMDIAVSSNSGEVTAGQLMDRIMLTSAIEENMLNISLTLKSANSGSVWNWVFGKDKKIDLSIKTTLYVPVKLSEFSIDAAYSDIKSESVPMGFRLNAKYGDVDLQDLQKSAAIVSRYSDIKINKATDIDIKSNYGDITLNSGDAVSINSSYADIIIGRLNKILVSNNTYGDVQISELGKSITSVKCTGVYSDYIFIINDNNALQFDIQNKFGDVVEKGLQLVSIQDNEEHEQTIYRARTKGAAAVAPLIHINSTYGDITLKKY